MIKINNVLGEPYEIIIDQTSLDHIVDHFKFGLDLRESIRTEMYMYGEDKFDLNTTEIYFEEG